MSRQEKLKKLKNRLKSLKSVLVAYSGGVDSTLLLKMAKEALDDKVLAVTALSETYPARELACARSLARTLGVRHKVIKTQELKDPHFRDNPQNRCYYCKKELFSKLKKLAREHRLAYVIDGSNADDLSDYRPGALAKKEFDVLSPLQEAGFTKKDVRALSKKYGLSTWCKPALACLASRVPYHSKIDKKRLMRIDKAEGLLRKSFHIKGNLRVRDFQDLARIEVDKEKIKRLAASTKLAGLLGRFGYKSVVVDLKGYRTGSLNTELSKR